jgi:ubiquinone/menaquinone biosynthesis C-methylase UbiE
MTDPQVTEVAGYDLNPGWWSRPYEYAWALEFVKPGGGVVADMGCGYTFRPFKEALAEWCDHVYAVDQNPKVLELDKPDNVEFVVSSFDAMPTIPDNSLDALFCISVLEENNPASYWDILWEFARIIKPKAPMVFTFDVPYDRFKVIGNGFSVVDFCLLFEAIESLELKVWGGLDFSKKSAIYHDEWNLACFHLEMTK